MCNDDVEISLCRPTERVDGFYRNGEGDEVIFVHEGSGDARDDLRRRRRTGRGDYVVVPRGTTYRFAPREGPQRAARRSRRRA